MIQNGPTSMPRTGWSPRHLTASCDCMRQGTMINPLQSKSLGRMISPTPWPSRPRISALQLHSPTAQASRCCQQPTSGSFIRLMSAELTTGLATVAWSKGGRQLYAGGRFGRPKVVVRRWDASGRGRYTDIPVSEDTIMQMLPLNDDSISVRSQDPAFGLIYSQGWACNASRTRATRVQRSAASSIKRRQDC